MYTFLCAVIALISCFRIFVKSLIYVQNLEEYYH